MCVFVYKAGINISSWDFNAGFQVVFSDCGVFGNITQMSSIGGMTPS